MREGKGYIPEPIKLWGKKMAEATAIMAAAVGITGAAGGLDNKQEEPKDRDAIVEKMNTTLPTPDAEAIFCDGAACVPEIKKENIPTHLKHLLETLNGIESQGTTLGSPLNIRDIREKLKQLESNENFSLLLESDPEIKKDYDEINRLLETDKKVAVKDTRSMAEILDEIHNEKI